MRTCQHRTPRQRRHIPTNVTPGCCVMRFRCVKKTPAASWRASVCVWLDAVDHVVHEIVGGSKAFKRGSLVITLTRRESLSPAGCQLDTGAAFIRAADIYLARRRGG